MKLPSNTITVSKGVGATFDFLINSGNYSQLLRDAYNGKIIYDKKSPIEKGKLYKLLIPAEKGQLVIELELEEFNSPHTLKYNILSVLKKRKKKEEILPTVMFFDSMSYEIKIQAYHGDTNIKFTTQIKSDRGLITKLFIYVIFGMFGWFSNRKFLANLERMINKNTDSSLE
ncbi:MAG: hypothetical protein V3U84_06265 [Thiotrichaceae bacterium]